MGKHRHRGLSRAQRAALRQQADLTKTAESNHRHARRAAAAQAEQDLAATLRRSAMLSTEVLVEQAMQFAVGSPAVQGPGSYHRVRHLLLLVAEQAPRLLEQDAVMATVAVVVTSRVGHREPWRHRAKGLRAALRAFVAHAFGPYPVPVFLVDSLLDGRTFLREDDLVQLQLIDLMARGRSLYREARGVHLPGTLTRRMCHIVATTPAVMDVVAAVRRAQVLGSGGDEGLAREVIAGIDRFGDPVQEARWAETILWFCQQDALDRTQVAPLCDYLATRFDESGDFRVTGRSSRRLLEEMERWHRGLAVIGAVRVGSFGPSGFSDLRIICPRARPGRRMAREIWTVTELEAAIDLVEEGRAQRHCVASLAQHALTGKRSYWSLRLDGRRCVTIEVDNRRRLVMQVRGRYNRFPTDKEWSIVQEWVQVNGLQVPPHVR